MYQNLPVLFLDQPHFQFMQSRDSESFNLRSRYLH